MWTTEALGGDDEDFAGAGSWRGGFIDRPEVEERSLRVEGEAVLQGLADLFVGGLGLGRSIMATG